MIRMILCAVATASLALALAGCGGGGGMSIPNGVNSDGGTSTSQISGMQTLSHLNGSSCSVSVDGFVWYSVPQGDFAPILASHSNCSGKLSRGSTTITPAWARPSGSTQAMVAIVSLQDSNTYQQPAMQTIAQAAHSNNEPATWMPCIPVWLSGAQTLYQQYNTSNGDDVEVGPSSALVSQAQSELPFFVPSVAVECEGAERVPSLDQSLGMNAFWGIAWDQNGTDGINDMGAPWGTYCSDPTSYKRPSPSGNCGFVGIEWTARDLTAAYFSGRPDIYSTNPDDLMIRGGYDATTAGQYASAMMDAYAAAGATQQFGIVLEEEPGYLTNNPPEANVLQAMYAEAIRVGMHPVTLAQLATASKTFAANPRAVAFPVIAPSPNKLWVGTIDFHDNSAMMTFVAGQTLPARVFEYSQATTSSIDQALPQLASSQLPTLTGVTVAGGKMTFSFSAPIAGEFGVAIWTNPATMGWSGSNIYSAGTAGAVIIFQLPAGASMQSVNCSACNSSTLPYST